MMKNKIPNVLTIAGSDSSGGAGIQADLKTISACGCYGLSVLTALTAQNTCGVEAVHVAPTSFLQKQLKSVLKDIQIDAIKIGMLGNKDTIHCVAEIIRSLTCPIVIDPVMVAKSGDRLLDDEAVSALLGDLLPLATIITPNLPEAADLLEKEVPNSREAMEWQALALIEMGIRGVLLKGGHLTGEDSPDLFVTKEEKTWFEGIRYNSKNTHGTGCTLSSALAAMISKEMPLDDAVFKAKNYINGAIKSSNDLNVGRGFGPVNHFWKLWNN